MATLAPSGALDDDTQRAWNTIMPFLDLPLPPSRTRTKVACAAQAKSLHADPTSAAALCATGLSDSTRKSHSSAGGSRSSQETTDSARDLLNIALGGPQSRDSLFGFGDVDLSDRIGSIDFDSAYPKGKSMADEAAAARRRSDDARSRSRDDPMLGTGFGATVLRAPPCTPPRRRQSTQRRAGAGAGNGDVPRSTAGSGLHSIMDFSPQQATPMGLQLPAGAASPWTTERVPQNSSIGSMASGRTAADTAAMDPADFLRSPLRRDVADHASHRGAGAAAGAAGSARGDVPMGGRARRESDATDTPGPDHDDGGDAYQPAARRSIDWMRSSLGSVEIAPAVAPAERLAERVQFLTFDGDGDEVVGASGTPHELRRSTDSAGLRDGMSFLDAAAGGDASRASASSFSRLFRDSGGAGSVVLDDSPRNPPTSIGSFAGSRARDSVTGARGGAGGAGSEKTVTQWHRSSGGGAPAGAEGHTGDGARSPSASTRVWESQLPDTAAEPQKIVNLAQLAYGKAVRLGRPIVRSDGFCLVGTELADPEQKGENALLGAVLDVDGRGDDGSGLAGFWRIDVTDEVRDVKWISDARAAVALGASVAVLRLSGDDTTIVMPTEPQHAEEVREVAVNPCKHHQVVSGGFDFAAVLTDVTRLGSSGEKLATLEADGVIGSVAWHSTEHDVASWTRDDGFLELYDFRVGRLINRVALEPGSYTHAWVDSRRALVGYGYGDISVVDMRRPRQAASVRVPAMEQVGELLFSKSTGLLAAFGTPECFIWNSGEFADAAEPSDTFHLRLHGNLFGNNRGLAMAPRPKSMLPPNRLLDPELTVGEWLEDGGDEADESLTYKLSGSFFPNNSRLVVADSAGQLGWFEL